MLELIRLEAAMIQLDSIEPQCLAVCMSHRKFSQETVWEIAANGGEDGYDLLLSVAGMVQ